MKRTNALCLNLFVITTLLASRDLSRAATEVSNLGEPGSASMNFGGTRVLGASFMTGDNLSYTLNSITLSLDAPLGNDVTVTLSLHADGSGTPASAALETFAPQTFSSAGNITFNSTGLNLAPNSIYFMTISSSGTGPVWFGTTSTAETGDWSVGDLGLQSNNNGFSWSYTSDIGQFSVDASPVPEPAPVALLALSAGCFVVWRRRKTAKRA